MNQTDLINDLSIIGDNLFKEMLFNAEGQQCTLSYEKVKTMSTPEIVSFVIDFFADPRPGWEGKMLSVNLCKKLYTLLPAKIAQLE
jgi:hypothetical protein